MAGKKLLTKYDSNLGNRPHVISTKKLSRESILKFEKAGIQVTSYDAVKVSITGDKATGRLIVNRKCPLVFTSKNGVVAGVQMGLSGTCYAIAPATMKLAEERGFEVMGTARNAAELARRIVIEKESEVTHITTADRRDELKKYLDKHGVTVHEYECYTKEHEVRKWGDFDAVMFFAPSQVDSFFMVNEVKNEMIFCVGKTTAEHAFSKGVNHVQYCKTSSEEHLVDLAIHQMTNE